MKKCVAFIIVFIITAIVMTFPYIFTESSKLIEVIIGKINIDEKNIYIEVSQETDNIISEIPQIKALTIMDYFKYRARNYIVAEVPSSSMENTIMSGSIAIIDKNAYLDDEPKRYDVIMLKLPEKEDIFVINRIIGLPGETLEIKNGSIYINNNAICLIEPYLKESPSTENYGPYAIADGQYFVMGDNRNNSFDSRFWQNTYLPQDYISGKVVFLSTKE